MIEVRKLSNDEVERFTLEWVNEQRKVNGMEPLKALRPGKVGNRNYCAVARSMKNGKVNYTATGASSTRLFFADGREKNIDHPPVVTEFVHRFDSRRFPKLRYESPS